ncbi:MAG: amidinotransferase [Candidatus Dadabacteria bacterium]|nr:MAG: amidinotransferase [Candidatus Dadabacteria bacterium]
MSQGKGRKFLMCPPDYFELAYCINPWMKPENKPLKELAEKQWQELYDTICKLGGEVSLLEPVEGLPDLVFTANGGLVKGNKCVIPRFAHKERQGEESVLRRWFESNGYEIYYDPLHAFEGEGDALFAGSRLIGGTGPRTRRESYAGIVKFLDVKELILCELITEHFYHLDTCFCPLDGGKALIYPQAFSSESFTDLENTLDLYTVSKEDAHSFCCNAIVIDKNVVMASGSPDTERTLVALGYNPVTVNLSEFQKSGGSAKCMALYL